MQNIYTEEFKQTGVYEIKNKMKTIITYILDFILNRIKDGLEYNRRYEL